MNIVDEDQRSPPQGRVVVLVEEDQHRTSGASERLHTTVYRRRLGSSLAEQRKKMDLDWKSGSATVSGTRGFLQLAETAPNVQAKLGRREAERGNE
jgi:hypothetical protein